MFRWISYILLRQSIKRHGIISPVLVSKSGVVLDGNRRVQACRSLGIPVPAVVIDAEVQMLDPATLTISCPVSPMEAI